MAGVNLNVAHALRAQDTNGNAVSGAKLTVYEAGTTTAVTTYSDVELTTANASPVVADSSGSWGPVYVPAGLYKIDVTDSADASLPGYPEDNVSVPNAVAVQDFNTRTDITTTRVAASVDAVRTSGYSAVGDGGGALYKRVVAEPSHEFKVQSADGDWFEGVTGKGVSFRQLGATGDGSTDDITAINNTIGTGANFIYGHPEDTYLVSGKVVPQSDQTIDMRGGAFKMAGGTDFTSTEALVELNNSRSGIINFVLDGNKANVTHNPGNGSHTAGLVVRTANVSDVFAFNGRIKDANKNGLMIYSDGASRIRFSHIKIESPGVTGFINEIPVAGNTVSSDISLDNIMVTGAANAGCYLASGRNVQIINSTFEGAAQSYFYIGDADGGLFDCKAVNCKFVNTNNAVDTIRADGEVRTGGLTGNRNTCHVDLLNCEVKGAGGGVGLRVTGGARVRVMSLSADNLRRGVQIEDGRFDAKGLRLTTLTEDGLHTSQRVSVDDLEVENYGSTAGNQGGVFLNTGSDGSRFRGVKIGAASGEGGEHGITGVSSLVDIEIHDFRVFNGTGTKLNFTTADMDNWFIYNTDTDHERFQRDANWNKTALYLGLGWLWIDSTGDLRVKTTKPTSDTDGTVVGTQS